MADFVRRPLLLFREYSIPISGCWFHDPQAVLKSANKLGLKEDYQNRDNIKHIIRCILRPASAIAACRRHPD